MASTSRKHSSAGDRPRRAHGSGSAGSGPSRQSAPDLGGTATGDAAAAAFGGQSAKVEQTELIRLRKEVAKLRMERDILREAAAYFARESM